MVQIVTDTVPNIPQELAQEYGIYQIPTYVTIGVDTYRDYFDLSSEEFYKKLEKLQGLDLPSTSQPPVTDFTSLYEKIHKAHPDDTIISIHVTNKLSGTVESARRGAAKVPSADIRIFDTLSVGIGQGLIVMDAARMAKAKMEPDQIIKRLTKARDNHSMYMIADTLEYLQRGGRIGRAARFLGTLLDMKPILTLKDGAIEAHDRQRSFERARETIVETALKELKGKKGIRLGVTHSAQGEKAEKLAEELKNKLKPEFTLVAEVGPSMGVHLGPGALGLAWYVPEEL